MTEKPSLSVLLVEDHSALAQNIITHLENSGHRVDYARDGVQGLSLALTQFYDVLILDLQLPRLDGIAVCRSIRERAPRYLPIIMLTARDTLDDKRDGFGVGADDYLTKPFELQELEFRCLALSRRVQHHQTPLLRVGELSLDRRAAVAHRAGQLLRLQQTPFEILAVLMESWPGVVTRSELNERLWGDEPPESGALRTHIYSLRQVMDKPFATPLLKTVHGVGFTLDVPHEQSSSHQL